MAESRAHFHVGIVVEDLEVASRRLTELLGIEWGPIVRWPAVDVRDDAGNDIAVPSNIRYSAGHPSIELIEEVPGTVWVRNPHSNLHHIGFWTPTFDADSAALIGGGCPLQLAGRSGEVAPAQWVYHGIEDLGIRVELLDDGLADLMAGLFEPTDGA